MNKKNFPRGIDRWLLKIDKNSYIPKGRTVIQVGGEAHTVSDICREQVCNDWRGEWMRGIGEDCRRSMARYFEVS